MKTIPITDEIRAALEAVEAAERGFVAGRDSMSLVELPRLDLANAVLRAVRRHGRLPARADHGVVYVTLKRTRRRQA